MKRKIIIDTDPGHDDVMAIMLAIKSNVFDIQAITTICGNSTIANTTRNARFVLDVLNRNDIPVFSGGRKPARSTIHKLTSGGVVIHVSDGVTFALKLQNQKLFYWRTGADVVLLIEEMTKREIDEYLEKEGERVLEVAGGVDFASDNGNKFIKKGGPFTCIVSKQNSGPIPSLTDTLSPQDVLDILESVRIAGEAEQTVLPYFKGVPTHLVREIVKNFSN